MGNMEESKEVLRSKINPSDNNLLMKPFSLGWTREVVMRVITKSGAPNCDVYYFSPSKKRFRSLTQLKSILTDGLSPECFSFKKKPLGLSPDLETIRNAKIRGKKVEKSKEKKQNALKKSDKCDSEKADNSEDENENENENENEAKELEKETKGEISEAEVKLENDENLNLKNDQQTEEVVNNLEKDSETRNRKTKEEKVSKNNSFNNKKKTKRKTVNASAPVKSLRLRKNVLKKMMIAKQAKQEKQANASKKILKKIVVNLVKSPNKKLAKKRKKEKETSLKSTKNKKLKLKNGKKLLKNSLPKSKTETVKESESNEAEKKSAARDLKSIVKKNIGKYREMREKQKLGAIKNQMKSTTKRIITSSTTKARSEPISKNKSLYLKALEKGWRRELVYRSNCARAGQMADVYYFHPNGKKLRSCREVSENLTPGLSIECFTFRKEAIGCGEPYEVVRNARFIQKN